MAYSDLTELKKHIPDQALIELTDDNDIGAIDETKTADAIEEADSEIDIYLGQKYSLPLTTVPALIRRISAMLAIYFLYQRRVEEMPKSRFHDYETILKTLKMIADGKLELPISQEPDDFATGSITSSHFATTTALSGEELTCF
jgi:phage gp36-like protein